MANIESVINWFRTREGKVTYDMAYPNRLGPNSYDCSSAVYYALIEAGFLPKGTGIGSTESLYTLEGTLLQRISRSEVRRGDIFISGGKGTSAGANGHTGVFVSNSRIIHCNYGSNGISETSTEGGWMGGPPNDFYRLKGSTPEQTKKGEITMQCLYTKPLSGGSSGIFYFNGVDTVHIQHMDTVKLLKQIYKANNGKDIPEYTWNSKEPWYTRLEQVAPNRK
ncbi:hypothetical protein UAW_02674 [Enterococcus haemoperoxidus ATCC BAA-382]|uniref:NlpC/P60 domain-containing protein n=2 Tax=Enterococcus haemoperoxidus TaxID=155618 RepID=R2SD44_9ENTE|nr:peptidoglycan amidohydrolase family protein [Enterococcus haemoperoxidus]EOH93425.1 hypothetical protein UAW_02674 [Enterococcus haemoperoxidus ATCC BAA-382]EOT61379.1 hypothetical protein I583_00358 [Enterococcus haemoperoxidus ATCC BAA-382]